MEDPELRSLLETMSGELAPYEDGGLRLTDDKAPVELLGMSVIDAIIQEEVGYYRQVEERAASEGAQVIPVCAKLEAEIAELPADEKQMFLDDLGVPESGLDRLVKASYTLLGLISYLTSGEDECRAWTITKGTKAPQAAGKIHSDFERGFIRAEVIAYDDLMACGSMAAAREKGLIRSEGKEYIVQDGDIILFRFNV